MSKAKAIFGVIIGVIVCYGVLAVFVKFLADQSVTTNQALDVAHNMAQYPGTSGFLLSTPWIMYFVPTVIGIILIVMVLRQEPTQ